MREQYDYVLIDTPPVGAGRRLPLPWPLGRWRAGGGPAHKTPRKMVTEALRLLGGSKVLGLVFNGDDRPLRAVLPVLQHPDVHHVGLGA